MAQTLEQILEQARVQVANGQYAVARRELARMSNSSQHDASVQEQLGRWFARHEDYVAAAFCFDRWVRADGASADALICLGHAVYKNGSFEQAAGSFEAAVRLSAERADAWASLGDTYRVQGFAERARHAYERARAVDPHNAQALAGLATVFSHSGDDAAALALLDSAPPADEHVDLALLHAHLLRRDRQHDAAEARLRRARRADDLAPSQRAQLDYALGDALDAQGRVDEAFAAYLRANASHDANYDTDFHRGLVAFIAYRSSARRSVKASAHSVAPLFIVGMPRSGMSLMARLLSAHAGVASGRTRVPLAQVVAQLAEPGKRYAYPEDPAGLTAQALESAARAYRANWPTALETLRYVCDCTAGNWLYLDMIARLFPNARVVNMRRNISDTCWSLFSSDLAQYPLPFASSLEDIGEHYVDYHQLMEVWRAAPPLPVLDVDYEALVTAPDAELARVLEFLGLAAEPAPLTAALPQPLHDASVGRANPYEDYLGPMLQALAKSGIDTTPA